jgi:transcriptional regulator with XRE-family HTH domain
MTPFGERVRSLRARNDVSLKQMARDLKVSPAYLSVLEHGCRGPPTPELIQRICGYFNIIWDEAEDLERCARLSHPRIRIDTAGLSPRATELANRLSQRIGELDEDQLEKMLRELGA